MNYQIQTPNELNLTLQNFIKKKNENCNHKSNQRHTALYDCAVMWCVQ